MPNFILQPWPWWLSGIAIGLVVPALHILAGKRFGISTSLQQIGALCVAGKGPAYLRDFDRQKGMWTLVFVLGIALGGFLATRFLTSEQITFLPVGFHSTSGAIPVAHWWLLYWLWSALCRRLHKWPRHQRYFELQLA